MAVIPLAAYWKDLYAFLLNASGALMLFVYIGVAASQLILRTKTPPEQLQVKAWLHPWGSIFAIAGMGAVLLAMAITPSKQPEFIASVILSGGIVLSYFIFRRGRA